MEKDHFARLADDELLVELGRLAAAERLATVRVVAALAEVDARRLYLGQSCSSLFVYCTRVLHFSEHAAYGRIEAARAARRFPILLDLLERGDLTLTNVCLLAPHLNGVDINDVLARARHRSKREVEQIVAALRPRPDAASAIRKLPTPVAAKRVVEDRTVPAVHDAPAPSPSLSTDSRTSRAVVEPLAPERYKVQLTIGPATRRKLQRAQDLMRHSLPSGDLATILDRALDLLVADLERTKIAVTARPRTVAKTEGRQRYIPAAVRREVWRRDGGRCAFVASGARCLETGFLEFHHRQSFAAGGVATTDNIELRCRAHNQYEADLFFGGPLLAREGRRSYAVNSVCALRRSICASVVWADRSRIDIRR